MVVSKIKIMILVTKLFLLLLLSILVSVDTYSMTNTEIIKICRRARKKKLCIRRLKTKKENLNKGRPITIPVVPFKN